MKLITLAERKYLVEKFKDDSYLDTIDDKSSVYGVIYKITNDINNMIYIGKTRRFNSRVMEHIRMSLSDSELTRTSKFLYEAIRSIGLEHFKMTVIDVAYSIEELADKEVRYIVKYKSILPEFGYNTTIDRVSYIWSEETSIKKSKSHIGIKSNAICKKKNSIPIIAINIKEKEFIYCDSAKLFGQVILNGVDRSIVSASLKNFRVLNDYYLLYMDERRMQFQYNELKLKFKNLDSLNEKRQNYIYLYEMIINKNVENIENLFKMYYLEYNDNEVGYIFREMSRVCENSTEAHVS